MVFANEFASDCLGQNMSVSFPEGFLLYRRIRSRGAFVSRRVASFESLPGRLKLLRATERHLSGCSNTEYWGDGTFIMWCIQVKQFPAFGNRGSVYPSQIMFHVFVILKLNIKRSCFSSPTYLSCSAIWLYQDSYSYGTRESIYLQGCLLFPLLPKSN